MLDFTVNSILLDFHVDSNVVTSNLQTKAGTVAADVIESVTVDNIVSIENV